MYIIRNLKTGNLGSGNIIFYKRHPPPTPPPRYSFEFRSVATSVQDVKIVILHIIFKTTQKREIAIKIDKESKEKKAK